MADRIVTKAIQYNCGCRFKTRKESEAVDHTLKTGHTLTALGSIKVKKQ